MSYSTNIHAGKLGEFLSARRELRWRSAKTCEMGRLQIEPETPAAEVLTEDEGEVIGIVVRGERLLPPAERGRPYPADIQSWVVLLARIAG